MSLPFNVKMSYLVRSEQYLTANEIGRLPPVEEDWSLLNEVLLYEEVGKEHVEYANVDRSERSKQVSLRKTREVANDSCIVKKIKNEVSAVFSSVEPSNVKDLQGRVCSFCGKEKDSTQWTLSNEEALNECDMCYKKSLSLSKKICSSCGVKKRQRRWHLSDTGKRNKCHMCYRKARPALTKVCSSCHERKKLKTWYLNTKGTALTKCFACFNKI